MEHPPHRPLWQQIALEAAPIVVAAVIVALLVPVFRGGGLRL